MCCLNELGVITDSLRKKFFYYIEVVRKVNRILGCIKKGENNMEILS